MGSYKLHICIIYYFFMIFQTNVDATKDVDESTKSFENQDTVENRITYRSDKRKPEEQFTTQLIRDKLANTRTKHIGLKSNDENNFYENQFNDKYWKFQWYAHDTRTKLGPVMDHNLVPVYKQGITGNAVVVGIIGDGVKQGLDELQNLKNEDSRYESNTVQTDPEENVHGEINAEGTRMAGVIAMKACSN